MRRGSSNAISPTNFGWDSGWHGRNVKDLGSRIDNVHNERRSSGFDPRSSASISSDHMEPTFSSPPHQHKKRLEHKGGMKLKRSGSAPRRRRSSLGTTESWEALKRTQQQQSYHQPRARPQKQRPLSLSSTYHISSSNSNNSTTLNIDEIMSMKISKQKKTTTDHEENDRPLHRNPDPPPAKEKTATCQSQSWDIAKPRSTRMETASIPPTAILCECCPCFTMKVTMWQSCKRPVKMQKPSMKNCFDATNNATNATIC